MVMWAGCCPANSKVSALDSFPDTPHTVRASCEMKERDAAMRAARDDIVRRVGDWLRTKGFKRVAEGHFTQESGDLVQHVGFQKLSSGRGVRVMCHITRGDDREAAISGPWSDPFETPNSPNKKKYNFGWSTQEKDIAKCAAAYCRYIDDVVIAWFREQREESPPAA